MKVTLRKKELAGDRERLYLDIYNPEAGGNTKRKKENLNLFLYTKPKTPIEKTHNKETLQLAETIKGQKQIDLQNGINGFGSKKESKGNFIDYFEKLALQRKASLGNYGNWDGLQKHNLRYLKDSTRKILSVANSTNQLIIELDKKVRKIKNKVLSSI